MLLMIDTLDYTIGARPQTGESYSSNMTPINALLPV